MACITLCDFSGSGSPMSSPSCRGIICQLKPNLSLSHLLKVSKKDAEPGIWGAINKYGKMMRATSPELDKYQILRGYIKYVLESGSSFERTRLMRNISNKLIVFERTVLLP